MGSALVICSYCSLFGRLIQINDRRSIVILTYFGYLISARSFVYGPLAVQLALELRSCFTEAKNW
jgi:hypothetical protein